MRYISYILLFISMISITYGCLDPFDDPFAPDEPTIDKDTTGMEALPYELLWQIALHPDSQRIAGIPFRPLIYKDKVIFSKLLSYSANEVIQAYDKLTGEPLWAWDEYFASRRYQWLSDEPVISKNILYGTSRREIFAVDMDRGTTVFKSEIPSNLGSGTKISFTLDRLYHEVSDHTAATSTLQWYDHAINEWQDIFVVQPTGDGYDVGLHPPAGWIDDNGDSILVFQDRQIRHDPSRSRSLFYSYNMSKDSVCWIDTFMSTSRVMNPYIEEDRIYFQMFDELYCINKFTGKIIWTFPFDDENGNAWSNIITTFNRVYLHTATGKLIALDKKSGKRRYAIDYGSRSDYLVYSQGRLYITGYELYIVDAISGRLIHKIETHNDSRRTPGDFQWGVAIDEENDLLYVQDEYFAMCFKVPE